MNQFRRHFDEVPHDQYASRLSRGDHYPRRFQRPDGPRGEGFDEGRGGPSHRGERGGWGPPRFGRGDERGWAGPRGPRRGRGDVRGAVVLLLAERPMHGYEVIHEITERSNGAWKPSPGAIYPTLKALEEHGIVTSDEADGKRTFVLTNEGRALAEELGRSRPAPWKAASESMSEERQALRSGVEQLTDAARQVAGTGTADQQRRAAEILTQARRELYKLLAEEA